jgi:hypothetical protein
MLETHKSSIFPDWPVGRKGENDLMVTRADPTLSGRSNPKFFPVRVTRMPPVVGKRTEAEVMEEMVGRV